jgi:ABC-type cobalamin transport system ATPase subunit
MSSSRVVVGAAGAASVAAAEVATGAGAGVEAATGAGVAAALRPAFLASVATGAATTGTAGEATTGATGATGTSSVFLATRLALVAEEAAAEFIIPVPLEEFISNHQSDLNFCNSVTSVLSLISSVISKMNEFEDSILTLMFDRCCILMDEISSGLDSELEAALRDLIAFFQSHSMTIIVTHRLETILNSAELILLDEGRIIARGPHAVMKGIPKYQEFLRHLN